MANDYDGFTEFHAPCRGCGGAIPHGALYCRSCDPDEPPDEANAPEVDP